MKRKPSGHPRIRSPILLLSPSLSLIYTRHFTHRRIPKMFVVCPAGPSPIYLLNILSQINSVGTWFRQIDSDCGQKADRLTSVFGQQESGSVAVFWWELNSRVQARNTYIVLLRICRKSHLHSVLQNRFLIKRLAIAHAKRRYVYRIWLRGSISLSLG